MGKHKYYVIWKGRETGIFDNWSACKASIDKYEGAQYKSFVTEEEAKNAFKMEYWKVIQKIGNGPSIVVSEEVKNIITPSICVDAACSGNPGDMEYRGVDIASGKEIFHSKVFKEGTNNIGEFLAIVHGLSLLKLKGYKHAIYSDSATAISWIKSKKCNTKLPKSANNAELFDLIERAEKWLANNTYDNIIFKWDTNKLGEIPADFGRK